MEPPKKDDNEQQEKAPGVPIKTYKWEDVRRSRQRGGYPWTHLYKGPFNETIDPEKFKMDKMSKPNSSATLKSHLQIEEITNGVEHEEEYPENVVVQDSDSSDHSKFPSSFIIQEEDEIELNLEEAESSDNISQYLDKEERRPESVQKNIDLIPGPSKNDGLVVEATNGRKRAKSEEPTRNKRKRSVDSSYSRISLPKLGFLKRLKNAKNKIKIPKISSSSTLKKSDSNKEKQIEPVAKKEVKTTQVQRKPNEKPVYIHIPLKPPEGETDEFSYLEFEEKKSPQETTKEEPKAMDEIKKPEPETSKNELILQPFDPDRRYSEISNPDEIVAIEILKSESIDLNDGTANGFNINGDHQDGDIIIIQKHPESSTNEDVAIIILGSDEPRKPPSGSKSPTNSRELKRDNSKRVRAKSAEPERKRKLSIESSYSRKSLSKLAWLNKKLKEGKDKVKFPTCSLSSLFRTPSKKKTKKGKEKPKIVQEIKKDVKKIEKENITPQYIHIPLKPPTGQSDEFSYLEFEQKENKKTVKKEEESIDSVEGPKTEETEDVQMILLTPPSDDEILDDRAEIPETPSEDQKEFFEPSRINELKEIAKDVADKLSPETKRKKLASLNEEKKADNAKVKEPTEEPVKKQEVKEEKVVVDEEDGLKSSEQIVEKAIESKEKKEEMKSSLKGEVSPKISPILKKKVSFKRRSKDENKNGIYEDVQVPKSDVVEEKPMEIKNQLLTDEEKIASAEEDPSKWSKSSDHYYEPVNPPPDDVFPAVLSKLSNTAASSTTSMDLRMLGSHEGEPFTAQEIQTKIENKFLNKSPERTVVKTITEKKTTRTESPSPQRSKKAKGEGKFQKALKLQAGKFKTKLHGIKKPNISLPSRPKFEKPNLPKFNLPKIPDKTTINLPKFTRKTTTKQTLKQRQLSTESNAGDTKKSYFNFSTYPRFFKKKQTDDFESTSSKNETQIFATVPRTNKDISGKSKRTDRWGGSDTIRIPLHPSDSFEEANKDSKDDEGDYPAEVPSHIRYDEDIDIDDAYEKENQEIHSASPFSNNYNSRWDHGSFRPDHGLNKRFLDNLQNREYKVTDLDSPEDESIPPIPLERFDANNVHSSESSIHQRGVLEEIDSDEFFLRQKGISQDNIEVGAYLSSEIREAFKSPMNALSNIQVDPNVRYKITDSNQSLPESPKRKAVRKPKRKKTPHVSQEQISFDQEDSEQEFPPSRPKRRSRKNKKTKQQNVVPYQETIPVDEFQRENLGILGRSDDEQYREMYENEKMIGKDQPEINIIDPYTNVKYNSDDEDLKPKPVAPKRRNKSLRSLTNSEQDSILDYIDDNETCSQNMLNEYMIPTPEEAFSKHQRSVSHSSLRSEEVPKPPPRCRTGSLSSRAASQDDTTSRIESLFENQVPCVEEPCSKILCDYMGYAIVDKDKKREPPLPPPRTPPRRKRSMTNSNKSSSASELRFFTVPRQANDGPPMRPLRNYSTLGPSRPPRRKPVPNMTDEEKENVDITQYIEIEDEPTRKLQSGDVVQKMRDRPLPAPPRPPRKSKALNDITSEENIMAAVLRDEIPVEETVSTQTGSLSDDIVCEEVRQEANDRILPPSKKDDVKVERRVITPTHYSHEETVTHATLLVEPLNGAKILPDSELSRQEGGVERTIPVRLEDDDDETSEIPEDFKKLKSPRIKSEPNAEIDVLKAQKLQVADLDVDRLSVNELLANRIVVSEIDSSNIQTNEISSKTGALKVGEIELPPSVVQQLFEKLQQSSSAKEENTEPGQKKTWIKPVDPPTAPKTTPLEVGEPIPQADSLKQQETVAPEPPQRLDSSRRSEMTPQRPPRQEKPKTDESDRVEEQERPPPRPPQPAHLDYIPSQPPASFYALRAQQYVDNGDIPLAPRRRRHHHHKQTPSRSSSSEDSSTAQAAVSSRRRYRSPEPSIPELTGQLLGACGAAANNTLKRLIEHITNNILRNTDGKQDLHVMIVILLVLIAGLILLGWGDGKTVHHHHWEYFNPPRDT